MPSKSVFLALIIAVSPILTQSISAAQQPESVCDLPFVASRFEKGSGIEVLVGNLAPENSQVHAGDTTLKVKSISIDSTPKRVALILDARSRVDGEEWGLETELAISLVGHGRKEDQFALFVANAAPPGLDFQTPDATVDLLQRLKKSRPSGIGKDDMTEVLLTAAKKLDPPKFGDTLFLFGRAEHSGNSAEFEELRTLLLKNRVRFFGESFTNPLKGNVPPGWNPNTPLPATYRRPELDQLSSETGYPMSYHQLELFRQFKDQLKLMKNYLGLLYEEVAEPYRLSVEPPVNSGPATLEINLIGPAAEGIREYSMHYQHTLFPCAAQP